MTILQPSSSELSPFHRLHPTVQRWIYDQQWRDLRDIQAKAIAAILDGDGHVILAAATSAGKTEAAFLPILSAVADRQIESFAVLYVSPLKALINDQFRRLEELCERLELPVTKWHGDAAQAAKARARRRPLGIVLITPESIEALLIRRGPEVRRLFGHTAFIVIDELHAFMAGERGVHLASLMKRIEAQVGRTIRMVALSATIGDFAEARAFLDARDPARVTVVDSTAGQAAIKLQVRGLREPAPPRIVVGATATHEEPDLSAESATADHLFRVLRGSNNLVFAPSRKQVEGFADSLLKRSEAAGVPNEFFPHHGSLSKSLREQLEERLKSGDLPTTAVATTTLELGIDIGSVSSVAQIGPPASIASLRQRLGRSGRREGQASQLRIYVTEEGIPESDDVFARLRPDIVQAVAAVRLLLQKWVEPAQAHGRRLSTLLHQTLAILRERGGCRAAGLYEVLCGPGPFQSVSARDYAALLRAMAATPPALIEQSSDGVLLLGPLGERLTDSHEFFAVFATDDEYRIVTDAVALGTVPIFNPLQVGDYLTFAGRRWIVKAVDDKAKLIKVAPAPAGRVPLFASTGRMPLHDRVVAEMQAVYRDSDDPPFLDATARSLLREGRAAYAELDLEHRRIVRRGDDLFVLAWRGTRATNTLRLALAREKIPAEATTLGLYLPQCVPEQFRAAIRSLAARPPTALELARHVENLRTQKYDDLIADDLLRGAYARAEIDLSTLEAVPSLLAPDQGSEPST